MRKNLPISFLVSTASHLYKDMAIEKHEQLKINVFFRNLALKNILNS